MVYLNASRPSAGKKGSGHQRAPSLDAALRRLRLSDETYYSASASASADQEVPPVPTPLPPAERPASRFALDPAASSGGASDGGVTDAATPEGEYEEEAVEAGDEAAEVGSVAASPALAGASMDLAARGDTAKQAEKGGRDAPSAADGVLDEPGAGDGVPGRSMLLEVEQPEDEQPSVWHSYSAAELSLPTQCLLVDWLLDAPDMCRQEAFLELGRLLITSLVLPAQMSCSPAKAFALDKAANNDEAVLNPPSDGRSEQNAVGTVAAFLAGTLGVPHDLLSSVSPLMLAQVFQNLPQTASAEAWSITAERDIRAAVLLLLAARCKGNLEDTAAAGGSSLFVGVLNDRDPRVRHIAASFLQAHFMASQPRAYRRGLRQLVIQAQQSAEDRLCSAFLQVSSLLEMRLVDSAA